MSWGKCICTIIFVGESHFVYIKLSKESMFLFNACTVNLLFSAFNDKNCYSYHANGNHFTSNHVRFVFVESYTRIFSLQFTAVSVKSIVRKQFNLRL